MVLGFKIQFIGLIKNGVKKHTIRQDKNNRWKPGNIIHGATGVRTKNYNQIFKRECISVQRIYINPGNTICRVLVDGKWLNENELQALIINDGFDDETDFFEWFNKPFTGKIIHWTNLKY